MSAKPTLDVFASVNCIAPIEVSCGDVVANDRAEPCWAYALDELEEDREWACTVTAASTSLHGVPST